MKGLIASVALFAGLLCNAKSAPVPTYDDLRYSDAYGRSTLDLWLPQSDEPTPLILVFHGGGFKAGSKERNMPQRKALLQLLDDGIAVASVGYPFLGDRGTGGQIGKLDYATILLETANSIRFLQANAAEYNLDPERFVVGGISAGAVISIYLTYAEPLGISACLPMEQPYGVEMIRGFIREGGAPMILCTYAGENNRVHHPQFARAIKERCDEVGVTCYLYGSGSNGLPAIPDGRALIPHAMEIIRAVWAGQVE